MNDFEKQLDELLEEYKKAIAGEENTFWHRRKLLVEEIEWCWDEPGTASSLIDKMRGIL